MKTLDGSETKASIFSKLSDDPSKQVNTRKMVSKILDKKREIKTLFLQTIGKFKQDRKPLALIRFEEGYKKHLFSDKEEVKKKISQLKREYSQNGLHKSVLSSDKIKTGDLIYWNANLFSSNFLNRMNSVKRTHLCRSKFFSIDQHEVDLFYSHMPTINHKSMSSKSERNMTQLQLPNNSKTDLTNKIIKSLSTNNVFYNKQSGSSSKTYNYHSTLINKSRKRYMNFTPKNLLTQLISLDSKQNIIDKRLSHIITRAKTSYSGNKDNGNIKEEELDEMEAVYDIKTKPQLKEKKKILFYEAKKRQRKLTTTQAVMIRLTDMIGVINAETAKNCAGNIYDEYVKVLSLYDNDILKNQPKLVLKTKEKADSDKRLRLEYNHKKMKKMEYNITKSQNQALDRIVKFTSKKK